jgi:uncharacterized Zn finger protein
MDIPSDRVRTLDCPKCALKDVRSTVLTGQFVYLRCWDCGEVWCIPERRAFLREVVDQKRIGFKRAFPGSDQRSSH